MENVIWMLWQNLVEIWQSLVAICTDPHELWTAIPSILTLMFIEGVLSADNIIAIASLASYLPTRKEQGQALVWGLWGAVSFRFLAILLMSVIIENLWIKIFGAAYLLYLMCRHIVGGSEKEIHADAAVRARSFWGTVLQIELMDLSLSIDNVVAALAIDKRPGVVLCGVVLGLITLRLGAKFCIRLIERYPVLKIVGFILVGYVGTILLVEMILLSCWDIHIHVNPFYKFLGTVAIVSAGLWYDKSATGKRVLRRGVIIGWWILKVMDFPLNLAVSFITSPIHLVKWIRKRFRRRLLPGNSSDALMSD